MFNVRPHMQPSLRPAEDQDFDLAYAFKIDAMKEHITAKWAWDEDFQLTHHRRRWNEKPWQMILFHGEPVGTVSVDWLSTHLQFGEFYIASAYRGRGLGTFILNHVLSRADENNVEARLEYLKWNPVSSLYLRHGFRVVGENEVHYFAVRQPSAA
jgi:GNAT superfamily N-acetyltransferase